MEEPVDKDCHKHLLKEKMSESNPTRMVLRSPIMRLEDGYPRLDVDMLVEDLQEPLADAHPKPHLLEDPEE